MPEYFSVAGSRVAITRLLSLVSVDWAHECDELPRDNPVEVSVLDLFVVFVLAGIELVVVVPAELEPLLEAFEAMQNGALVKAVAFARITEGFQSAVIISEHLEGVPCLHFENDKHEGTHEEAGICELRRVRTRAVVENASIRSRILTMSLVEFS